MTRNLTAIPKLVHEKIKMSTYDPLTLFSATPWQTVLINVQVCECAKRYHLLIIWELMKSANEIPKVQFLRAFVVDKMSNKIDLPLLICPL